MSKKPLVDIDLPRLFEPEPRRVETPVHTRHEWGELLAAEMPGWNHAPPDDKTAHYTTLTHAATGASIDVNFDSRKHLAWHEPVPADGRLKFSVGWVHSEEVQGRDQYSYGRFAPANTSPYRCTCSAGRTPASIAASVLRKIVDKAGYLEEYIHQCELLAKRIDLLEAEDYAAAALAQALGKEPPNPSANRTTLHVKQGWIEVRGENTIFFELRAVPLETAIKIATLLKEAA